jgi:transposase
LDDALKASNNKNWYRRFQVIALSAQKYTVQKLSEMFKLCQATIRSYIHTYNQVGLEALTVSDLP